MAPAPAAQQPRFQLVTGDDGQRVLHLPLFGGLAWRVPTLWDLWRITYELGFEIIIIVAFLKAYNMVRNTFGSSTCTPEYALSHSLQIVAIEEHLFIFWEQQIQALFLPFPAWIRFWNIFYGTAHMGATITVLITLFIVRPSAYQRWRTVFVIMNLLALVGFAGYPLMPPRLVNECVDRFGGCQKRFHFVDTMEDYGGLWSWRNKDITKVSNHYAAMPSMHVGYAAWCAWVVIRNVPFRWVHIAAVFYPLTTLYCIVVTGNHFFLDAVFGVLALLLAYRISDFVPRMGRGADDGLDDGRDMFYLTGTVVGTGYGEPVLGVPYEDVMTAKVLLPGGDCEKGEGRVVNGGVGGSPSAHISMVNLKSR